MGYAIVIDGVASPLVISNRKFIDALGVSHPVAYLQKWDDAYMNSRGLYRIEYGTFDSFEFRKTGSWYDLIDGKAVETIITEAIPLGEIKLREKNNVAMVSQSALDSRPRVDSGLGFFVDGGRNDLDNFEQKEKRMADTDTTAVKDADNIVRDGVTKAQMRQICDAIFANVEALLLAKWGKQAAIDAATTVQEVRDAIQ